MVAMIGRTDTSGRYYFMERLGEGGFGTVYRAEDTETYRLVAIKVLHLDLARYDHAVARFEREQEVTVALSHPFIVKGLGTAKVKGYKKTHPALVMEYVEGKDLFDILRDERTLPQDEIARIVIQLGLGLDYLHRRGLVHRDFKPDNVMKRGSRTDEYYYSFYPKGEVCIFDFSIVGHIGNHEVYERETGSKAEERRRLVYKERQVGGRSLTANGTVFGTPEYVSPEQARGDSSIDGRSDLYSLGIMMYRAIAGVFPFRGSDRRSVFRRQIHEKPNPLNVHRAYRPTSLDHVCMLLLEKDPDKRYQTGRDLVSAVLDALPASEADRIMLEMTVGLLGVDWNYEQREKPASGPESKQPAPEIYTTTTVPATAAPTNGKIQEPVEMTPEEPRKPSGIGNLPSFF